MKKLYRKGSVHPSPPLISDPLAFLPAAILTLSAALSPEDRQVLAYLISCSSSNFSANRSSKSTAARTAGSSSSSGDHTPSFSCNCFRCYTSYWVRWDSSPNRQLIHEIIDALEGDLVQTQAGKGGKKERRKRGPKGSDESKRSSGTLIQGKKEESVKPELPAEDVTEGGLSEEIPGEGSAVVAAAEEMEKGSVRKIVSFIGERFWNIWT